MRSEQMKKHVTRGAFALAMTVGAGGGVADKAFAQTAEEGPFSVSGHVDFASEYIFRGVSLSDHQPALQGGLTLSHDSGFYVGTWGSTGRFHPGEGTFEVDYVAGYAKELSGISFDLFLSYYTYPGDKWKGDYVELTGKASYDLGLVAVSAGAAYVFSGQNAYGNSDAIYLFSDLQIPLPVAQLPLTAVFHIGYEDFGQRTNKLDWSAGLAARIYGLDLSLAYVDTDLKDNNLADSRVLFSIGKSF
ncbi:TorF family putative porin [Govanella unica]|uniref:TorF family putative porin n=1 Tax=Govanella unica TaxID=2975056 RepID=A0A9X3Z6W0_9PROT|nr:TorF family putative porin [Govania unica]MDA5193339.1 TorF family putative porin [Govania unica]